MPGNKIKDLTGYRFEKLVVLEFYDKYVKGNSRDTLWKCVCDCGNITIVRKHSLQTGHTKSCGCWQRQRAREGSLSHGFSKTPEYSIWSGIKARCYNQNHPSYKDYGAKGITMSDHLAASFINFINEVGWQPSEDTRWSVDRIDNSKGYIENNLRWATYDQQVKNRGMVKSNKSGVTGVHRRQDGNREYYVASWKERGKKICKYFSITKLGEDTAFEMACNCRRNAISKMVESGDGYSSNHGQISNTKADN